MLPFARCDVWTAVVVVVVAAAAAAAVVAVKITMHGERQRTVFEFVTVDGLATSTVPLGEVPTLAHELGDHAVKRGTLEVQRLALPAHTLFAGAERTEVLSGLGDDIGGERHLNAARGGAADGHIEEDNLNRKVVERS